MKRKTGAVQEERLQQHYAGNKTLKKEKQSLHSIAFCGTLAQAQQVEHAGFLVVKKAGCNQHSFFNGKGFKVKKPFAQPDFFARLFPVYGAKRQHNGFYFFLAFSFLNPGLQIALSALQKKKAAKRQQQQKKKKLRSNMVQSFSQS